jgi:DNA-binding response OmpR family regulator
MAEKILIVDDDIDSLKLIGLMLQRQGYEISAAGAGAQAISKALAEAPDLIILDVMMPDMDGYEVCRRLRSDPSTQGIPIIMFTAKTMVDDKVTGFEAGADDYLTKPTHPAELASRVKAVLARSAAQRRTPSDTGIAIGVLGTKGGVGTTTLAMNIAAAIGQKEPTILADIRPGQGSLGLSLGLGRSTGMANLLNRAVNDITARVVEGELVTHSSGIKMLLSSARPKEAQLNVNTEAVALIIKHLRSLARNVVLDLGAGLNRQNARLVKEVDQLGIVVEPYRVALNMARDLIKELESIGVGRGRTGVVLVNRSQSTQQVPWQEAEQILGQEILALIAPAADMAFQASEAGFPLVLFQPTSVIATQLTKLAEDINSRARGSTGGTAAA